MAKEMIQEFFVSLGFEVDQGELNGFKDGLKKIGQASVVVGVAIAAMAVAVTAAISSVANEFDELDDSSRMIGTTAERLKELQYAGEFMDTSAEAVTSSLKSLGKMAGEASLGIGKGAKMFEKLGIEANNSDGSLRDTIDILGDVQAKMDGMAQGEKLAIMSKLGLDPTMIDMLSNDIGGLTAEFQALSDATGIDWNKSGAEAGAFADNLKKLQMTFGLVWKSVAAGFFKKFGDNFESLQKKTVEIAPKLIRIFTPILNFFVEAASLFGTFVGALVAGIDWIVTTFDGLDESTKTTAGALAGIGVAWLLLNAIFSASPLGRIIGLFALLAACVAILIDDFDTFNEGGESFFDWSGDVIPNIKAIGAGLGLMLAGFIGFKVVASVLGGITTAFNLMRTAILGVNLAFLANPIVMGLAVLAAGLALGYLLYQQFGTAVLDFFMEKLPAAFDVVNGVFQAMIASVIEFAAGIKQSIGEGIDWIVAKFLAIIAVVSGVLSSALASVINFVVMIKQWISDGVEYIKEKFTAGGEVIHGVFSNLAADIINSMAGVLDFFGGMWDSIKNGASDAMGAVGRMTGAGVNMNIGVNQSPLATYGAGNLANTQNNNLTFYNATDPQKTAAAVSRAVPQIGNGRNTQGRAQ